MITHTHTHTHKIGSAPGQLDKLFEVFTLSKLFMNEKFRKKQKYNHILDTYRKLDFQV